MTISLSDVALRQASSQDAAGVVACLADAFEPYRDSYTPDAFQDTVPTIQQFALRMRSMSVLIAEHTHGEVVGTIGYQVLDDGDGHLRGMGVLPAYKGNGIASRLPLAAEDNLRKLGCIRVTLDTTNALQRAQRFYRRHGYEQTGVVRDFFGMPLFEFAKPLVLPAP